MNEYFANNLLTIRKAKRVTQEQLAEKLFVTRQAVSKWERGENEPDIVTLCAISSFFDVTIDDLLKVDLCLDLNEIDDTVVIDDEQSRLALKKAQAQKLAKKMVIFALSDIAISCLIIGIIFTACVDYSNYVWIVWFALPIIVPCAFAIRFNHEIGRKWLMYFFPIPFLSGIIYLLIHYLSVSTTGAWLAFLLIPVYYSIAILITFLSTKKKDK